MKEAWTERFKEVWEDRQGRLFIIGAPALLVVVLVALLILHLVGGGDNKTPDDAPQRNNTTISDTDKTLAKNTVTGFVNSAGRWGAIADTINSDNILTVRYLIQGDQTYAASTAYVSRSLAYKQTRNLYIPKVSSLWYEDSVADGWNDDYAAANIIGMNVTDVNLGNDGYASQITINNNVLTSYTTSVKFTEHETKYVQASDDSSWDGTFNILSKDFHENATVTLIKMDNQWRVYNVQGVIDPFVFDTWGSPTMDYTDTQFGMNQVGTLKATRKR